MIAKHEQKKKKREKYYKVLTWEKYQMHTFKECLKERGEGGSVKRKTSTYI